MIPKRSKIPEIMTDVSARPTTEPYIISAPVYHSLINIAFLAQQFNKQLVLEIIWFAKICLNEESPLFPGQRVK